MCGRLSKAASDEKRAPAGSRHHTPDQTWRLDTLIESMEDFCPHCAPARCYMEKSMQVSDEFLLLSYAQHRDEEAFRALAERYLGLIFQVALRRTGNRQLAEEASQNILCAVAEKAGSLARKPELLPAWLHRATLYESAKAMRSESSQQRRKLSAPPLSTPEESSMKEAFPYLDAAINKLSEADRAVILLHYFENHPFPRIATMLGKNPATVQKQSRRALEKLSRLLRGKGLALSVTTLATGLAEESAKAAPATLLKSAISTALHGASGYSITGLSLMFAMKSKAFGPALLLACLLPAAFQQIAISRTQSKIAALQNISAGFTDPALTATTRNPSRPPSGNGLSSNTDLLVLIQEQEDARRAGAAAENRFMEKLRSLSSAEMVRLLKESAAISYNREKKKFMIQALVETLGEKDPALVVTTVTDGFMGGPARYLIPSGIGRYVFNWTKADPESARRWHEEMIAAEPLNYSQRSTNFTAPLLNGLLEDHSSDARALVAATPLEFRQSLLQGAIINIETSWELRETSLALLLLPIWREFLAGEDEEPLMTTIAAPFARDRVPDLIGASALLSRPEISRADKSLLAEKIVSQTLSVRRMPFDPSVETRISSELSRWLETELPGESKAILERAELVVDERKRKKADEVIRQIEVRSQTPDDQLIRELTQNDLTSRLGDALEIAGKIKDPEKRSAAIQKLNQQKAGQ